MPPPAPLLADDPAEIGGHRLLGRLGSGGQGTVYLAEPLQGGARVAVKLLSYEAMGDTDVRRRFVREAQAARRVASFCTAAVLAADVDGDTPYIVSEYVAGHSLHQRIRAHGPMEGGDLGRLAVATATALVAIHGAGIVHRDFKPGNVLLGDGGARVIDFGIAQITEGTGTLTNSPIGTPSFMAPEQIERGEATPASDVFAWGASLAFAATGASPFAGTTVPHVLHNVLNAEPDLSALPDTLRPLAAAALAKDPAVRPSTVDLLMTLLGRQGRTTDASGVDQVMRAPATTAATAATAATARGWPRRPLGVRIALFAAAGLGAAGLAGLLGNLGQDTPPSDETSPDPTGDTDLSDIDAGVARFTEEEAGTWEGVSDSGYLYEIGIEPDVHTAGMSTQDSGECSTEIRLTGGGDGSYRANITFSGMEPDRCVNDSAFWEILNDTELTFDGDVMTIDFFADGESAARSTIVFSRAG